MKRTMYERVTCKDGYSVSIQASETSYSEPRTNDAVRYESVELGFPSHADDLINKYAEDEYNPCETVYGWVPVSVVNLLLAKHGGMIEGTVPPGVTPLYSKGYGK